MDSTHANMLSTEVEEFLLHFPSIIRCDVNAFEVVEKLLPLRFIDSTDVREREPIANAFPAERKTLETWKIPRRTFNSCFEIQFDFWRGKHYLSSRLENKVMWESFSVFRRHVGKSSKDFAFKAQSKSFLQLSIKAKRFVFFHKQETVYHSFT